MPINLFGAKAMPLGQNSSSPPRSRPRAGFVRRRRGHRYLHAVNDISAAIDKLDDYDRRLANYREES
jgi:hypothetical protein